MNKRLTFLAIFCGIALSVFAILTTSFAVIFAAREFAAAEDLNVAVSAFLSSDAASITCTSKQKYYVLSGTQGKTEMQDEFTYSCAYSRNGEGYDVKCNTFTVKDNVIYLGGKKAAISDADTADRYERVFLRHQPLGGSRTSDSGKLYYDPMEVVKAISKYRFTLIGKSTDGEVAEYRLYVVKSFYDEILKYGFYDYEEQLEISPAVSPVVVTLERGKLSGVRLKFNGYFINKTFEGYTYRAYREYSCDIEYSDVCEISAGDTAAYDGLYRAFVPNKIAEVGNYYTEVGFYDGKAYCVSSYSGEEGDDHGTVLRICDLKTGRIEKVITSSENSYQGVARVAVKDGYVYAYGGTDRTYEYDIAADKVTMIDGCYVSGLTEDGVKVTIDGVRYYGADLDHLTETEDTENIVYDAERNRYYRLRYDGDKKYLASVTKSGEVIKEIEYDYAEFNSCGVVVRATDAVTGGIIAQKQLDSDLNEMFDCGEDFLLNGSHQEYCDKAGDLSFYGHYVKDESTGCRYFIDVEFTLYGHYCVFDGNMYFLRGGALYSSENYTTLPAEQNLFS